MTRLGYKKKGKSYVKTIIVNETIFNVKIKNKNKFKIVISKQGEKPTTTDFSYLCTILKNDMRQIKND